MEIIDYNQSLARQKDDFHKKNAEVRENYDAQAEAQAKAHEIRQAKQREAYKNDLNKVENSVKKERSQYDGKTEQAIADKKALFQKQRESEKQEFRKLRAQTKKSYDDQLRHVSKSYTDTAKINEKKFTERTADLKDQFTEKTRANKSKFDSDVQAINKRANEKAASHQDKSNIEKKQLVKTNNKQIENLQKSKARERAEASSRHSREIEDFRTGFKREKDAMKQHHNTLQDRLRKTTQAKVEDQQNRYDKDSTRTRDAYQLQAAKAEVESNQKLTDQRRGFEDQLIFEKRQKKNLSENSNTVGTGDNQTRHLKKTYENRIDSLKNEIHFRDRQTKAREEKNTNDMRDAMDSFRNDYNKEKDKMIFSHQNNLNETRENILDGKNKEIAGYQNNVRNLTDSSERALFKEKASKREALFDQKIYADEQMASTTKNWRKAAGEMVDNHAEEKDIIFEKHNKTVYEQRIEARQKRADDLDRAAKAHELKQKNLKVELGREKEGLSTKLDIQKKKNAEDVRELTDFNQQTKIEMDRANRFETSAKHREYENRMTELRRKFGAELDKAHQEKEQEVNFLTERHADQIRRVKREHKMEMNRKELAAKERYKILLENKKASENTIRHQYEIKLERQKQLAQQKLDQANNRASANAVATNKA